VSEIVIIPMYSTDTQPQATMRSFWDLKCYRSRSSGAQQLNDC